MKNRIVLLVLMLFLAGCGQRDLVGTLVLSQPAASEPAAETAAPSDEFYLFDRRAIWLDGGETLAVPDGGTIRYLGLDNRVKHTVELPVSALFGNYSLVLSENRILVMGGYDAENYPGEMMSYRTDGKWELVNGSIWDADGTLLKEFPRYYDREMSDGSRRRERSDEKPVPEGVMTAPIVRAAWVNDDLLALDGHSRLFFYRRSTDALTLADDMSGWIDPHGKMGVYYGIERIFPYGEGAYYFAHKNEEKSNAVGTVWYADETGAQELFDGREFQNCIGNERMLVLVGYEGEQNERARVFYARTDDRVLHDLGVQGSWVSPSSRLYGSLATLDAEDETHQRVFYLLDADTGSFERFVPPQANEQCELYGAKKDGTTSLFYEVFETATGARQSYRWNPSEGEPQLLAGNPYLFGDQQFHLPMTHFIGYQGERFEENALRILPIA